jgi:hypothetical protein
VARWNAQPSSYIIVPNDSISGEALIGIIAALIDSAVKVGILASSQLGSIEGTEDDDN